ncbi:SPC12-domain-containing protein [Xylona heveae TC161]|uniref:Signal peptidase complex subunit 1 n=1 Tax=Xylona heveae (strain CBS 132557 / TC161) TaxID=1328760 RepID=A0A165FT68_XYLHT|nr:SPC12-domain-containing protein [Xylona heveae TC161]KZF21345.1 SPC12-domain-containing protein [Xylona heveae TC161]
MAELLERGRTIFEGQIDFEGQHKAELLTTTLLGISGFVAFVIGYLLQDIRLTLAIGLGGTALTFIAVVPPWKAYNKHPIAWLPAEGTEAGNDSPIIVDGKKASEGVSNLNAYNLQ